MMSSTSCMIAVVAQLMKLPARIQQGEVIDALLQSKGKKGSERKCYRERYSQNHNGASQSCCL